MSTLGGLVRIAALLPLVSANASVAQTHCTPSETVAFSCSLKAAKVVSLCLGHAQGQGSAPLSYRFGRLGKPEFVFPAPSTGTSGTFRYAHYARYQVDRTEVSFSNAGVDHVVFDYREGGPNPSLSRGIRATRNGKDIELNCKGRSVSRLLQLQPLLPCDAENALASCN